MEEEEEVLEDEDITNIDYEEDNPNKRFKKLTWLFGIVFVIALLAYGTYSQRATIQEWFASEPEPERPAQQNIQSNVSSGLEILEFQNSIINMMMITIPIIMGVVVLTTVLNMFRRLGGRL